MVLNQNKSVFLLYILLFQFGIINTKPDLINQKIVGGDEAEDITDFPYQVMVNCITGDKVISCGGALTSKNQVVTAAHCVKSCKTKNIRVLAGVDEPDLIHQHKIKSSHPHPKYKSGGVSNDIAVLCLENNLKINERIKPINIAKKLVKKNTKAVVSGWGLTDDGVPSRKLMYAYVTVIGPEECEEENNLFDERQICTDSDGVGPCKGDSGGPLVANNELIGIVSYGALDCEANFVRMYTNVYYYRSFIEENKC